MILYGVIAVLVLIICWMTWSWYIVPKKKTQVNNNISDLMSQYSDEHTELIESIASKENAYDISKILLTHIETLTDTQNILKLEVQENKNAHEIASETLNQKSHEITHISHQMRTSLSGLLGFTQFLESTKLDEEQQEFLSIISTSSNELLVLVNNIIDMTPQERTEPPKPVKIDGTRIETPKNDIPYVLVVDDNDINKRLLSKVLENENLNVTYASDGKEAVDLRKGNNFDIIFMDIQMPVMDGVDASKAIREYENNENISPVPIVALTANTGKHDRDLYLDAGMTDYMAKPIVVEEVRKRIAQL